MSGRECKPDRAQPSVDGGPDANKIMSLLKSKAPAAGIAAAFILTAAGARLFSLVLPRVHWEPVPGMHIHHYVYGIFILTIAGYLALIFKSDRASLWIALL